MLTRRLCALTFSAMFLAACGGGKQEPAATAEPAAQPAPAASPAAAPVTSPADKSAPAPTRTARINEDGSETIEENTGDTGERNPLLAAVASTAAAATTPPSTPYKEGVNYTRLVPAQPTSAGPDQVEVIEMFWYGCGHCNALDPLVESWRKRKPGYIKFMRVPVMWDNDVHRSHARLFYTIEDLGKLEQLHPLVFKEIHVNGNMLVSQDPAETEQKQRDFLKRFGVTDQQFKSAYHSFNVETNLQRAEQITLRYSVLQVPTFIINGKYITDVSMAGGTDQLFNLVDALAAKDHTR